MAEEDLPYKVQGLPQELQDMILDGVLAADLNTSVTIDRAYKPPYRLAINRKTRRQFAENYYKNCIFSVPSEDEGADSSDIIPDWLLSLTSTHRNLLSTIRHATILREPKVSEQTKWRYARGWAKFAQGLLLDDLECKGIVLGSNVVECAYRVMLDDGTVEMRLTKERDDWGN